MSRDKHGFSLIELLVVMVIMLLVLGAMVEVYRVFLRTLLKKMDVVESEIAEGAVLEILRKDLTLAGFGIPKEGDSVSDPLLSWNETNITIRSTAANIDAKEASSWGYCFDGTAYNLGKDNFTLSSQCLTIDENFRKLDCPCNCTCTERLFYFVFAYKDTTIVRYVLDDSNLPVHCANGTFVLEREEVGIAGSKYPVLDCVADMRIFVGLNRMENGTLEWRKSSTGLLPSEIEKAREAIVYLLVQEGKKATNQVSVIGYPIHYPLNDNLTAPSDHYRWNVIHFGVSLENVVKRKNL